MKDLWNWFKIIRKDWELLKSYESVILLLSLCEGFVIGAGFYGRGFCGGGVLADGERVGGSIWSGYGVVLYGADLDFWYFVEMQKFWRFIWIFKIKTIIIYHKGNKMSKWKSILINEFKFLMLFKKFWKKNLILSLL